MRNIEDKIKTLPDTPGVYLFYNKTGELIYVGKATSLKDRVRSYFRGRRTPRPIEEMIHEVASIDWKETDSVLEAVILESIFIKKHQPKYNILGKDNKSWNYIVITKSDYSKVVTMRQHDIDVLRVNDPRGFKRLGDLFGPYPGLNTKAVMKILRRLFRFSTCLPARSPDLVGTKAGEPARPHPGLLLRGEEGRTPLPAGEGRVRGARPCLYYEMGQCLGVCTGEITPANYRHRVIVPLKWFLSGKKRQVIKIFEQQMKRASKEQRFEDAAQLRNQLHALERIHDVTLLNKDFFADEIKNMPELTSGGELRIEGYDISNLGATDKVGSMVVFNNEGPVRSQYRKFNIKTVTGQSDVDCLAEVLQRRLKHTEWPRPDVILIDGGRPQVSRIKKVFMDNHVAIPFMGIAKGPERKRNDILLGSKEEKFVRWVASHQPLLIRVRDEAHRFAIMFNRSKRKIR
ncbi:MAG: GIY-YIG nuclease family protein [Candidatus Magasanikbacteria bacterium]|nr:GIY-YIG nuclease family protein [Candidatus Magasanikbacteria bacterium]